MRKLRTYTVLLLRPDYVTDDYGQDTYMTNVEATTVKTAVRRARLEVLGVDTPNAKPTRDDLQDYFVLFVAEGRITDINPGDL